jgi:glycosyltransferase involved in cell wall biosynthesis
MRILVSSLIDVRKSEHQSLHEYLRHLSRHHEISVICINDYWKSAWYERSKKEETEAWLDRINTTYVTKHCISPILQDLLPFELGLESIREDFDVHFSYNTLALGYRLSTLLKRKQIRTVYNLVDDIAAFVSSSPQTGVSGPLVKAIAEQVIRLNIDAAEKTTITSDSLRKRYEIPSDRTVIIPNGVNTSLFRPMDAAELKTSLKLDGYFVVGCVGVLRGWITLEPLFNALTELDGAAALIVGSEGGIDQWKSVAERLGISERVKFTGHVPYKEVPRYISAMDVGIIPFDMRTDISIYAMPLKLFEYMACGKAVISAPIPAVISVAKDRVLYAKTAEEYAKNIRKLGDETLRSEMGQWNRKFIEDNYSWEKLLLRLEKTLAQVAN